MEDGAFVLRSMYAVHLRAWLRLFAPSQLLVADPAALLRPGAAGRAAMARLASFVGLGTSPSLTRDELRSSPSPGARKLGKRAGVHEGSQRYILGSSAPPDDVARPLRKWLAPHACDLAGLLRRHGLAGGDVGAEHLPWLSAELGDTASRACAGVVSVDEWFVGK